jgi:uncharacterized protein with PQ loop repeat
MFHQKGQIIAIVSGILNITAFSHLVMNVHVTKNTENLTFTWILLVLLSQSLLIIYGIINNAYGIYIPASILIIGILYISYVKINYSDNQSVTSGLVDKEILQP